MSFYGVFWKADRTIKDGKEDGFNLMAKSSDTIKKRFGCKDLNKEYK